VSFRPTSSSRLEFEFGGLVHPGQKIPVARPGTDDRSLAQGQIEFIRLGRNVPVSKYRKNIFCRDELIPESGDLSFTRLDLWGPIKGLELPAVL